jgi:starch-binding outer membrane protein, SusD/RagB family
MMKKYLRLITLLPLIVLGTVTSCNDYLETKSNSIFTEESTFSNLDFATKAVYGIYANLTENALYEYVLGLFFKLDNDVEHTYNADDGARISVSHYSGQEGNTILVAPWNTLYQTIERANICIENLPKSPIWEGEYSAQAKRLYAEAITLRALCYYELISLWGDVPFSTASVKAGDNFYLPKTDRDEIYEYLIKDLKDIQDYVPWIKEARTAERVNKGFVKGFRARLALAYAGYSHRNKTHETKRGRNWQEYYKIANQECKEIMASGQHRLNPSYENIFRGIHSYTQDLTNGEVIFEIAFGKAISGRVGQSVGMAFTTAPAEPKYGRAAAEIRTNPYYYYSFDVKDLRRQVNVELYNYGNTSFLSQQRLIGSTSFTPSKWRRSWINPSMGGDLKEVQSTGVNWPIMRYSDVVLMFAETENEINGPTTAAKEALASVRQRAFASTEWPEKVTKYITTVGASKATFFNAIVDERKWEFGGEMIRKYDLVRWNLLYAKIQEMKEENLKILSNDIKYNWVPDYLFWKTKTDNETIEILNPDSRLPGTAISGYTRTSWLPLTSASSLASFKTSQDRIAAGLSEVKNNHLYPIPATIIAASNGVLTNDQIP